jgi:hypothetical protein
MSDLFSSCLHSRQRVREKIERDKAERAKKVGDGKTVGKWGRWVNFLFQFQRKSMGLQNLFLLRAGESLIECFTLSSSMVVVWLLSHPHQGQSQVLFPPLPARSHLSSASMTSVAYRY